ncbi:hypothetical protein B0H16DRAFT_1882393 [Mycena metata]|uniref:Uncharacterized protein n=1 Tax=Mycena metata TaxID=1033252 RepID=A0AAD7NMK0_9AGAR|nr:hypothetical protein B0H16DRAFT_1882393 [Mycena metata]
MPTSARPSSNPSRSLAAQPARNDCRQRLHASVPPREGREGGMGVRPRLDAGEKDPTREGDVGAMAMGGERRAPGRADTGVRLDWTRTRRIRLARGIAMETEGANTTYTSTLGTERRMGRRGCTSGVARIGEVRVACGEQQKRAKGRIAISAHEQGGYEDRGPSLEDPRTSRLCVCVSVRTAPSMRVRDSHPHRHASPSQPARLVHTRFPRLPPPASHPIRIGIETETIIDSNCNCTTPRARTPAALSSPSALPRSQSRPCSRRLPRTPAKAKAKAADVVGVAKADLAAGLLHAVGWFRGSARAVPPGGRATYVVTTYALIPSDAIAASSGSPQTYANAAPHAVGGVGQLHGHDSHIDVGRVKVDRAAG